MTTLPGLFSGFIPGGRGELSQEEKRGAYRAMVACPTGSIRLDSPDPLVKDTLTDFPFPVDSERLPGTVCSVIKAVPALML